MSKNIKTVPTQDYNAVIAVAQQYADGLRVGSPDILEQAFHKEAVMYGFTNGKLLGGPISNLFDFVRTNGKAPDISTRLDVLAITRPLRWCVWTWKRTRLARTTTTT